MVKGCELPASDSSAGRLQAITLGMFSKEGAQTVPQSMGDDDNALFLFPLLSQTKLVDSDNEFGKTGKKAAILDFDD